MTTVEEAYRREVAAARKALSEIESAVDDGKSTHDWGDFGSAYDLADKLTHLADRLLGRGEYSNRKEG